MSKKTGPLNSQHQTAGTQKNVAYNYDQSTIGTQQNVAYHHDQSTIGRQQNVAYRLPGNIILKIIVAFVFALGFPILAKFIFRSHLSITLIIILVIIKPSLTLLGELTPKDIKRLCIILSGIFSFTFAFLITIGILITPANAYSLIFKAMRANVINPGRVSNLFVLFIAFFSTSFSCTIIQRDYIGPLLGIALVISVLSALIFQSPFIYGLSVLFILFCLIYIARLYLDKGYRAGNIMFSVIIIALCFGLGFGLHRLLGINRSRVIDRLSTALRGVVSVLFPQIPLMYELPEFGFAFEDEFKSELGSTPVLSKIPLFKVEGNPGERLLYLRTRIHDQFKNNKWETPAFSLYLDEKEKNKNKIQAEPEAEEQEVEMPFVEGNELKADTDIGITLYGEYFGYLPQTLDTIEFLFRRTPPKVVFGDYDKGFYFDERNMLLSGDTVYLRRGQRKLIKPDTFASYLQIPANLSPEIKRMARSYGTILTPRAKIRKIKEDLAFQYTYNIETGDIPPDENFLDNFLFKTKQGYSVHFSTALIMIARLNNIPARYATGFLAVIPQPHEGQTSFGGFTTIISGLSAHVWPEIWYDDHGWTTEEATPAVNPDFYTITENGIVFNKNIILNSRTQQQISAIMGEQVIMDRNSKDNAFTFTINPVYFLYVIIPVFFILLIIRYAYIFIYIFRKNRSTINMLLRKTVKKYGKRGIPFPKDIGWLEWGNRMVQNTPRFSRIIDNSICSIIKIMYGDHSVEKGDVKNIFALYRKVKSVKTKPAGD